MRFTSTFVHATQTDYDEFRKETLDAIAFVKKTMQSAPKPKVTPAHA